MMTEYASKSRIADPVSEEQWAEVQAPNLYDTPIRAAVNQCAQHILTNVSTSPLSAFTLVGTDWQMTVPPAKGDITVDGTSYPFTLSMILICEGYTPLETSFTFSRLKFIYSFGFDDFTTSRPIGKTHTDGQGMINDMQIYGDMKKKNTPNTLTRIIRSKMIPEFTRSLKITAEAMLQHDLHTIDNKAKSKTRNNNARIAKQLIKLAKELLDENN